VFALEREGYCDSFFFLVEDVEAMKITSVLGRDTLHGPINLKLSMQNLLYNYLDSKLVNCANEVWGMKIFPHENPLKLA
jgi:hypothetical protein